MLVRALQDCEHNGIRRKGEEFLFRGDPAALPAWMEPADAKRPPATIAAPKEPSSLGELGRQLVEESPAPSRASRSRR